MWQRRATGGDEGILVSKTQYIPNKQTQLSPYITSLTKGGGSLAVKDGGVFIDEAGVATEEEGQAAARSR